MTPFIWRIHQQAQYTLGDLGLQRVQGGEPYTEALLRRWPGDPCYRWRDKRLVSGMQGYRHRMHGCKWAQFLI